MVRKVYGTNSLVIKTEPDWRFFRPIWQRRSHAVAVSLGLSEYSWCVAAAAPRPILPFPAYLADFHSFILLTLHRRRRRRRSFIFLPIYCPPPPPHWPLAS